MSSLKAISYSIFGFGQHFPNSFSFSSYLRVLSINIKMAELIYPHWRIYVAVDEPTYNSEFKGLFDYHVDHTRIEIEVLPRSELCKMMIWRMRPVFSGKYQYVICRDADSLVHYKEAQAVNNYVLNGRAVHAITDSISHNISLMGGMVGFKNPDFLRLIHCDTWEQMISIGKDINWSVKGSDQTFMNKYLLPKVDKSMVEHYLMGMAQSWRGACYDHVQDDPIDGVRNEEMRASNHIVEHIGQAGFPIDHANKFIHEHLSNDRKDYYYEIERQYPQIHYWLNDK